MRRPVGIAFALGALSSLALGLWVAMLPSTPTWALWRLTVAIDKRDTQALQAMVDVPAVLQSALQQDLGGLGTAALSVLRGGKVRTAFDDPGVKVSTGDFLAAWWSLEREGETAHLDLPLGDREVRVELGRGADLRWRITGVAPLEALLRFEPPDESKPRDS
jgi:hypothetical protein